MKWDQDFLITHTAALAHDEIKHGLMLDLLSSELNDEQTVDTWDFESPGACAVKKYSPDQCWSIILGDLTETQARKLADITLDNDYPGAMGVGLTAQWFACRAAEQGVQFGDIEPQQIYATNGPITVPKVPGHARRITGEDDLFPEWLVKFAKESSPYDPIPTPLDAEHLAHSGTYMFWIDNGEIVSMAGITRQLTHTAAVTGVYTPPELRGRGYAAAITAAVTNRILGGGKIATLYTDLRVPASNRCYARIGFHGVATSLHFHRAKT